MRSPGDYIIIGFVLAGFGGFLFAIGTAGSDAGLVVAISIGLWVVGGVLIQIGTVGAGVHIGLRARADERARVANPPTKAKLNTAGQVAVEKLRRKPPTS